MPWQLTFGCRFTVAGFSAFASLQTDFFADLVCERPGRGELPPNIFARYRLRPSAKGVDSKAGRKVHETSDLLAEVDISLIAEHLLEGGIGR